ncbi:MAG: helix-turn-helix domain-containing protein [Chryseobacterium sp.]|jgi:transcriptional regulator with XRE-family HTH domain|uniref:helix-turn-helix domain-containing protein n=1 Tax=Chryseobacterium sp. TaxID=1871047 RepID=UPI002831E143|nr:helix-turn-helix domain-containing protein [Chryseobacterium sp.]MDR2234996.1 helix-turn-helix domain-containing protein [Chryseobacterium sp.]
MKNRVKVLREQQNMTQTELAEKSGLSLRTVQRIEAGSSLKGYTLKAIAGSLETTPEELSKSATENPVTETADRAKLINLSALAGLVLPFGGVIFPLILTYRTKGLNNKDLGKSIAEVQIIVSAILSAFMIISPFVQKVLPMKFPLFIPVLLSFIGLKLWIVFKNGISLNQTGELCIKLKTRFL